MKCPICKSESINKITNVNSFYSLKRLTIKECLKCELSYTDIPNKKNNKFFYKNIYDYSVHEYSKSEKLWRINKTFLKVSKNLNLDSRSNILDIGCMQGFFLNYLKNKYSCKVTGLETENYYLKKNKKNLNIIKMNLEKFSKIKKNFKKFDLIIMSHSFEHFQDPFFILECLKKLLNKDGKCLIIIPNIDSFLSRLFGKFWGWLQPAAHFYHYTKKSLSDVFLRNNFKYKLVCENGGDSLMLALTFINLARQNYTKMGKSKNSYLKILLISVYSKIFKYIYYFGNDELVYLIEKK